MSDHVSIVIAQADRLKVADHLKGLHAADKVLGRAGELLLHLSADRPEVSISLPHDAVQRAAMSFNQIFDGRLRLKKYFEEKK